MTKTISVINCVVILLCLSGCDKTLPPPATNGVLPVYTNAFSVSIDSSNNSQSTLTITNSVNSSANISNISDTISSALQARLSMVSGSSTCANLGGPLAPGSSCTYVFNAANGGAPTDPAVNGTITITPTFAFGNVPAPSVFPTTITSYLYAGGLQGVFEYNGTWTVINSNMTIVTSLALDSLGNLYAGNVGGVQKWNGTAWTNLTGSGVVPTNVDALVFDHLGNLYVGSSFLIHNVNKYLNGQWSSVTGGTEPPMANALAVDNNNDLYVGSNQGTNGVFKYSGGTWTNLTGGATVGSVLGVAVDSFNNVYAGNGTSVYQFTTSWSAFGTSSPNSVNALYMFNGSNLYAGSNNNSSGAGNVNYVLTTSGSPAWSAQGTGGPAVVDAITLDSIANLYAGETSGGVDALTGPTWVALNGTNSPSTGVAALVYGNTLTISH